MTFACEGCGIPVEVAVRRTHRYCAPCKAEARREAKARSDRKHAARVNEAGKRWRAANPEKVREAERRRPKRTEYQRKLKRELRLRRKVARLAPLWAAAAREMDRQLECSRLALPPGPLVEEERGPCCATGCMPRRSFVAGECASCGVAFVYQNKGGPPRRCCSAVCAKRFDRQQYRARSRGAFVEPVFRRKVFERDGWRCQLCRELVLRSAVVPHPRAPTIDHIVALAAGGEHSMANAQTAHFSCNSEKGAGARNDQLRLVG